MNWAALRDFINSVENHNDLRSLLNAILLVRFSDGYGKDAKDLGPNKTPPNLIDLALEKFSAADIKWNHPVWTHSLSSLTRYLWERGLHQWIKRFNEQAFGNAEKGWGFERAYDCCDRLVVDVTKYGNWDTDPATIGLTSERIQKIADQYNQFYVARAGALPFASAVAADIWKAKWYLSDPARILRRLKRSEISDFVAEQMGVLAKAGEDTSQYTGLAERLLEEAEK